MLVCKAYPTSYVCMPGLPDLLCACPQMSMSARMSLMATVIETYGPMGFDLCVFLFRRARALVQALAAVPSLLTSKESFLTESGRGLRGKKGPRICSSSIF
jgi:hypothetical protein